MADRYGSKDYALMLFIILAVAQAGFIGGCYFMYSDKLQVHEIPLN